MRKARWLIAALAFVVSLVLAGCSLDSGGGNPGGNPFIGTWSGYNPEGFVIRVVIDSSTWTLSFPGYPQAGETGTYTYSGNTITLFQGGVAMGTGTVSGKTGTITVTGVGTMVLTKQ